MQPVNDLKTRLAKLCLISLLLLFVVALASCQGTATPTRDVSVVDVQVTYAPPTMSPFIFVTSQPGLATLHGLLIVLDPMTILPAQDDAIYLVPIPEGGLSTVPQFEMGTVPQAEVDERTGEFTFTDIQAGQYAVVVLTKGGAQIPARDFDTASYAIFTVDASQMDTIVELGNLSLP